MKLQFNYSELLPVSLCDVYTHCAGVDLFVRGIHTVQLDAYTLEFESARDLTYAHMLLSSNAVYTVSEV